MKKAVIFIALLIGSLGISQDVAYGQADIDPVQAAISVKDLSLLQQAISGGSDVNQKFAFTWQTNTGASIKFEKATLLMYAISVNWYEGVLELIRAGAKTNVYVRGIKPTGMEFDRCPVKEIAEMSDMMMAVMAGNADIVKLMIIDGCDTRGTMAVELPKNCTSATATGGMVHMRSIASPEIAAILKEGKKAAWAQQGLPEQGKKPE